MENGERAEMEGDAGQPKENGLDAHPPPEKPVKRIRVTYEEYKTIANLLILHLRQVEEKSDEGTDFTGARTDSSL